MKKLILMLISVFLVGSAFAIESSRITGEYQTVGSPSINVQYYEPGYFSSLGYTSPEIYWPFFDKDTCRERQDFIVQVTPAGCEPAVVRSDLLEEQNVPVFCKLMMIQTNPLIDVSRIKTINFLGKLPEGVAGISYFPSRANLLTTRKNLAQTPIDDNAGYFVVSLKKQVSEKNMPNWISGNLTAAIEYNIEDALGIGRSVFYVSELSDEDWKRDYEFYSFWNGKGYIKADAVEKDRVSISIYKDEDLKEASVTLRKGETSQPIYLGGFYCAAGLKVRVQDISAPVKTALIQVDDKQTWVSKGDKILDEKCTVNDLQISGGTGKIGISCPVGRFDLTLGPSKALLKVNGTEKEYKVGEKPGNLFLGFTGKKDKLFVVLINDSYSGTALEFENKEVYSAVSSVINSRKNLLEKTLTDAMKDEIKEKIVSQYKRKGSFSKGNVFIIEEGKPINYNKIEIQLLKLPTAENREWTDTESDLKEYYNNAIKDYTDVAELYPNEKRIDNDYFEPYSAEALFLASELAGEFKMLEDQEKFLRKLYSDYPDSSWTKKADAEKFRMLKYDSSNSRAIVNLKDKSYFVNLLDFDSPTIDELSAIFLINGKENTLGLDEIYYLETNKSVQLIQAEEDFVRIRYKSGRTEKEIRLDLEKQRQSDLDGTIIKLEKINLKKQAKIVLESEVKGTRAYANFSFKIGIEKRAIKLSPEKTEDMIKNIDESIKKWEEINSKLGKVVKGLKGACFATSAVLIAKNLVAGFSGKSLARTKVMTSSGGWNDFCEREVSEKREVSIQKCLLNHNAEIEQSVSIVSGNIEDLNAKIKKAQGAPIRTDVLDIEGQVKDRAEMETNFRNSIQAECDSWEIKVSGGKTLYGDNSDFCQKGDFEDVKEVYLLQKTLQQSGDNSVLKNMTQLNLERVALNAQNNYELKQEIEAQRGINRKLKTTSLENDNIILANIYSSTEANNAYAGSAESIDTGKKFIQIYLPSKYQRGTASVNTAAGKKTYLVEVKKQGESYTAVEGEQIYEVTNDDKLIKIDGSGGAYGEVKSYLESSRFKESNDKAYQNKMVHPENVQVKYFDRAPYKGLPAEIPFDVENGWYVEMEYVLSGFGKPYDESGRVANFYICNVGSNGLIEFKKKADDICRYYNGVSDEFGFPGMDSGKSRALITKAKDAIAQAVTYYGKKEAFINNKKFPTGTSFGVQAGRCSDFMSPQDCNIMFNLCDPVICPSSRCDLGGAFPVDNVIQTGIIGSLVLCLPNAKEGILMPVCLSGVNAGIDGYLSILKSHRDCLNESLKTGRNIGICDEIQSIYLCEFFWRQMVPFADVIIPRLIEGFFNQGARGGGEYLTVQSSWQNTQNAINYFKNEYAVNSMKAFQMRSTEEAGSEICKSFISTQYPTDFDLLTEPDSPVQYHAWFSENVMTTATPYPTSHYKVYYHIYAGKDMGNYYTIYLKGIPDELAPLYVYTAQTYVVDSGFIAKGGTIDKARDFTAPAGYKELCININGQDECGFGKVSTSFAVDYVSDLYAEEQSEEQIRTSKECVAGTPSLYSIAQPNLQEGAEEIVQPELYSQGIVRVCSTYNPGKQVTSKGGFDTTNSTYDRWGDVGYCDDPTLRCWLDKNSVKNVIKNKNIETDVLKNVDTSQIDKGYLTIENSREIVKKTEEEIKKSNSSELRNKLSSLLTELNKLAYAPSNSYKALGLLLEGKLYDKIARGLESQTSTSTTSTTPTTTTTTQQPSFTSEWTDAMLKQSIVITFVNSTNYKFTYKYFGKWTSAPSDSGISVLNYAEGIKYLAAKAKVGDKFKVDNVEIPYQENLADKIFEALKK